MRTLGCHEGTGTLETILGMDKTPIHHMYRPCQPPVLEIAKKPQLMNSQVACGPPEV